MLREETSQAIAKIIDQEMAYKNRKLYEALEAIANYAPNFLPESCMNEEDGYEEGDESSPFFSDAYLYNLLGKDEARTLQALMRAVFEAAGVATERDTYHL